MAIGHGFEQAFGRELAQQAAPLALVEFLADSVHTQLLVTQGAEPGGAGTEQHIHHMGGAEALAGAEHGREGFLGWHGRVQPLLGFQATVAVATGQGQRFAEVGEQHLAPAAGRFGEADQRFELAVLQAFLGGLGAGVVDEAAQLGHVACPMHHPGHCWQSVAAGAAGFLVVGLQTLGQVDVGDEAHIGFVDAHAKGDRGHHHHPGLTPEAIERRGAVAPPPARRDKPQRRGRPPAARWRSDPPGCASGVDDPRLTAVVAEEREQLGFWRRPCCAAGSGCWADRNWR